MKSNINSRAQWDALTPDERFEAFRQAAEDREAWEWRFYEFGRWMQRFMLGYCAFHLFLNFLFWWGAQ